MKEQIIRLLIRTKTAQLCINSSPFTMMQRTKLNFRPIVKWIVSLVAADDNLIILWGLQGYVWVSIFN